MIPSQQKEQDIFSQQSSPVGNQSHSSGRVKRFLNQVIAVLIVGVIIGTAFLLFSNRVADSCSFGWSIIDYPYLCNRILTGRQE